MSNIFLETWVNVVEVHGYVLQVRKTSHFERRWMFKFELDVKDLDSNYTIEYI